MLKKYRTFCTFAALVLGVLIAFFAAYSVLGKVEATRSPFNIHQMLSEIGSQIEQSDQDQEAFNGIVLKHVPLGSEQEAILKALNDNGFKIFNPSSVACVQSQCDEVLGANRRLDEFINALTTETHLTIFCFFKNKKLVDVRTGATITGL